MEQETLYDEILIGKDVVAEMKQTIENSHIPDSNKKTKLDKIYKLEKVFSKLAEIEFIDRWRKIDFQIGDLIKKDGQLAGVIISLEVRPGEFMGYLKVKIY